MSYDSKIITMFGVFSCLLSVELCGSKAETQSMRLAGIELYILVGIYYHFKLWNRESCGVLFCC